MGSRRQRRVSWAAGPNLCKVRLFISEDSPSQAGLRPQDNLQAKGSCFMHAAGSSSDDSLPPGFESPQPTNDLKIDISQIPLIRWKCPSHILLDPDWHVASGEESKEIAIQNERMFGALEAMYPRASNIPSNPFVSPDVKDSRYDDSQTLSVPLIPVEDDDASDQPEAPLLDMPNNHHQSGEYDPERINVPQISHTLISAAQQQHYGSNGATSYDLSVEPDVLAAASAAFTAIMQSNQKGNMVDQDLLVKILSDPAQVERLTQEYNQIRHQQSRSSSVVAPVPPGPPPQKTVSASAPFSDHMTTFHNTNCTLPPPRMAVSAPVTMNLPPGSSQAMNFSSAPARGIPYYKTLIHQHGGERQEPPEQQRLQYGMYHQPAPPQTDAMNGASMVNRDTKLRPMKLCAYFNGPRGCRNGANCTFLHDTSARQDDSKGSKRIKLDSRIAGRN
ncbi:zinc finger CCCH domain-containing protein 30-like isoform X2 [Lolium rigidum]|uniref:zinc finger CCCH domain-containing protein 30-like isoform X2 n=1 Tax=Lolium rigidum TaxID=89674 RepID=UPI001F5DCAEB|nr:zinc finger CCCH domain-containing protein 30-like isoform X2 [Lolium rigidum]